MIPLCVPNLKGNEWEYVKECIDTEWVSSAGKYVNDFEKKLAEFVGAKHGIAVVNGTAALHTSLLIAGVLAGDEVIVPTATFIAPINVVRYLHAEPVFMDCDEFYNIDTEKTIEFIEKETIFKDGFSWNKQSGKRISAIMPVHVFGNAVWLDRLIEVCQERNIAIVEDATESLGTRYIAGKYAGKSTGTIAKFGCMSFNGNKVITTGGGGMIFTDDDAIAEKAKYLTTQAKNDEVRYIHDEVGYNFRLTNIQAALGVAQLEQLPGFLEKKKYLFDFYSREINKIDGLLIATTPDYCSANYWMVAMRIDAKIYGKDREQTMAYLGENKVQTRPLWQLNHLQKPYSSCQTYKIEKALELIQNTLNIPCSTNITDEELSTVCNLLAKK